MCTYLEHDALITVDQSAYRKRHNTQTALHKVLDGSSPMGYWRPSALLTLRNVSTQLTILFKKMGIYGFSSDTTDWSRSYLLNRQQLVSCHNELSGKHKLNIGVSQGSV